MGSEVDLEVVEVERTNQALEVRVGVVQVPKHVWQYGLELEDVLLEPLHV